MNRRHVFLLSAIVVIGLVVAACYQPTQFIDRPKTFDVISLSELQAFLGVTNNRIKIVFTNKQRSSLYLVDYSQTPVQAIKLNKPEGYVDSPLIDSSGKWITYFTAGNGVYIQKLDPTAMPIIIDSSGTEPHWWIKPGTNETYIVYSNNQYVEKGTLKTLLGYSTFKQRIDASGAKIGLREIIADKPFNGGLSFDGKYLCTGYSDAAFYNISASSAGGYLPIEYNASKTEPYQQICNSSISTDPTNPAQMMFLCFSGEQYLDTSEVHQFFGRPTRQHEYVFIVDTNNTIKKYFQKPSVYDEWQDPEWSNNSHFFAALGKLILMVPPTMA